MRIAVALSIAAGIIAAWLCWPAHAVAPPVSLSLSGVVAAPGNKLPDDQAWRTFAKPLAIGRSSMLLFQRLGEDAVIWQTDWESGKVSSLPIPEIKLKKKEDRYTALLSAEGLWLLGDTTVLIRPDGKRLVLQTHFNEPVAVVLDDQSVLVLGPSRNGFESGVVGGENYHMQQLALIRLTNDIRSTDRGLLSYDGRPNEKGQRYRLPLYGHGAIKLQDGRVLLFGGDRTDTLASIIEPSSRDIWVPKPLPPMPHERVFGVAQRLPDGRIAITGAKDSYCYNAAEMTHSIDVFDPKSSQWSRLPNLPFVPCADAYGADVPSMALTPGGSLLVGGTLEPYVMLLPRDTTAPSGYASDWLTYGRLPLRRISGVLQALSEREVAIGGGVENKEHRFNGCCYATSGIDHIDISLGDRKESIAMSLNGVGVAQRGHLVFAGSGRRFGFTSTGKMRYSAHAELIDLERGTVRQLPNMPFVSGAANAFWLDDQRVVVKGRANNNGRGFDLGGDLASAMPKSSTAMAVFNLANNRWTKVNLPPELQSSQLIGGEGDNALLLSPTTQLVHLNLSSGKTEPMVQTKRGRHGGDIRLLADGRWVLAGGEVQSETISVIDPDCEPGPDKDCPEHFAGIGPYSRKAIIEIVSPGVAESTISTLTMGSDDQSAEVESTVITASGQAIVLSQGGRSGHMAITRSSQDGKTWQTLPLPADLIKDSDGNSERGALALTGDPRNKGSELLFLRQGAIDADYVDDRVDMQSANVWWWDDATNTWSHVLQRSGMAARAKPLPLGGALSPAQGRRMMSIGWHLSKPVLWMESM